MDRLHVQDLFFLWRRITGTNDRSVKSPLLFAHLSLMTPLF